MAELGRWIDLFKIQGESGSPIFLALYIQARIIGFEYPVNDRKSQAGSTGFGGKKGVENRLEGLLRHTTAVICDFDADMFIL